MKIYFVVMQRAALPSVLEWLLAQQLWFGVEPWPRDEVAVQVKPEARDRLKEIVNGNGIQSGYGTI